MSNPRINARFRSLPSIDAQYTDVTGFEPGVGTITVAVDEFRKIPRNGYLQIGDGNSTIKRNRCRTLEATLDKSSEDVSGILKLQDRSWRLPYLGTVSGTFNRRDDSGVIVGEKRDVRELAEMCLKALGEARFDAAGMPAT